MGKVADIIGGGTPSTDVQEYWDGEIDWYSPTEIGKEIYAQGSQRKITTLGLKKSSAKVLPANKTILFTSRAGIGDMAILKKDGATNQGFQSLVVNNNYYIYFVYSMGYKIKNFALKHASGSTFLEISRKELQEMDLFVPTLEEQTKIGTFFKQLDDTIALHQDKLSKLQKLKTGYLQVLFPQIGEVVPSLRFANFNASWEQRKLGKMARFEKGKGYSKKDLVQYGFRIILYGRLYTNYQTVIERVDTYVENDEGSIRSRVGDVIVPSSGESSEDISRASVVPYSGIILGGDLNIIEVDKKILDPIFVALTISNGPQKKELSKRAQGKSVVHLHNSDLKKVNLVFPNIQEQERISTFLKQLDDIITLYKTKLEKLHSLKKVYLQKMFI